MAELYIAREIISRATKPLAGEEGQALPPLPKIDYNCLGDGGLIMSYYAKWALVVNSRVGWKQDMR